MNTKLFLLFFLLVFVETIVQKSDENTVDTLKNIAKNISKTVSNLKLPETTAEVITYQEKLSKSFNDIINQMKYFEKIPIKLDYLQNNYSNRTMIIKKVLLNYMTKIDKNYDLVNHLMKITELNKGLGIPFVSNAIMIKTNTTKISSYIHYLIMPNNTFPQSSLLPQILSITKKTRCNYQEPPNEKYIMFMIYLVLVSYELKAFTADVLGLQYQYDIYRNVSRNHFNAIIQTKLNDVELRLEQDFHNMKNWIKLSGRKITNCFKEKFQRDVNYFGLESFNLMENIYLMSSQISMADVSNNMVVTGVRFIKQHKILYTQIQQGQLMAGGWINQSTVHWRPVDIDKTKQNNSTNKNDDDLIVINQDELMINLNDVYCPQEDYAVTGVGLGISEIYKNENRIVLFIKCHKIIFQTGKLFENSTGIIEDNIKHEKNIQIGHLHPDVVQKNHHQNFIQDGYVKINVVQNQLVPFFDNNNVTSSTSIPISGVGLYHNGTDFSGGLLFFQLYSLDYSLVMNFYFTN